MLPGEGSDTDFPLLRLAVDIVLGASRESFEQPGWRVAISRFLEGLLCGLAGGIWVSPAGE